MLTTVMPYSPDLSSASASWLSLNSRSYAASRSVVVMQRRRNQDEGNERSNAQGRTHADSRYAGSVPSFCRPRTMNSTANPS